MIGLALLMLIGSFLFRSYYQTTDWLIDHQLSHFKSEVANVEAELDLQIEHYQKLISDSNSYEVLLNKGVEYHRVLEKKGIGIYIYQDENLKFWSSHKYVLPEANTVSGFVFKNNGVYLIGKKVVDGKVIIAQYFIKRDFSFENSYVKNSFQSELYLSDTWEVTQKSMQGSFEVYSKDETSVIYLNPTSGFVPPLNKYLIGLELLGLILFGIGIISFSHRLPLLAKLYYVIPTIGVFKFILWQFHLPANLGELDVFKSDILNFSSAIPSLGDLILNVYFVTLLVISFFRGFSIVKRPYSRLNNVVLLLFLSFLYFLTWIIVETVEGVVMNSQIPLDLSNILSVDLNTIIALTCIGGILATYLYISWKMIKVTENLGLSFHRFIIILSGFYAVNTVIGLSLGFSDAIELFWGMIVLFLLSYAIYEKKSKINFSLTVSLLFVFSMMVTHALREYAVEKEMKDKKSLLLRLSENKDEIAEFFFEDIQTHMSTNKVVMDLLNDENATDQELYKYIKQSYFNGFWEKYDLQVNPCFEGDSIQLVNGDNKIGCSDFFEKIIYNYGEQSTDGFYFLDNNNGRISYIGKVDFVDGNRIYFEFDSKFKPDGLGFPSLLLDKQIENRSLGVEYSFSMYKGEALSKQKGVYNFSTSLDYYLNPKEEWTSIEKDGYNHLVLSRGGNTYFLSKKIAGTWDQMAFYSYLFAYFSLMLVMGIIVYRLFNKRALLKGSFKARFQGLIIFILFFSTVFIGMGSIYYLKNQYNEKNFDAISEKIQSVKIEVQHKLGKQDFLEEQDLEYIQIILEKFSSVFFTDINLYDPNGELISSSQPRIFEVGLASKRMDPLAMYQMLYNSHSQFVQIEEIEGMQYLSAYVPFYNIKGELLAYLNLPYFARSNDLKNEISNFLVALLNIYALLIVIALVIALIITNRITEPLRIIQEKMAGIQLGKQNELIHYRGKDEIGRLINEYNRMVIEIAESAQRLAESEREDAWREMAQQVAHEIKNPLTPMKLSIQHLQMRWGGMSIEDKESRFTSFAKNLVEQIDTLSAIASEFSSFAKLQDTDFAEVELVSLIESSVDIYNGTNNVEVTFSEYDPCLINGDKDQILRVFNNLIKNAIQAIPEDIEGRVRVQLLVKDKFVEVKVTDNGVGISTDNQLKIFVPNFTTKNSGMGLGLAMVQKIMENMGGEISFTTEEGKGTEFTLQFPLMS